METTQRIREHEIMGIPPRERLNLYILRPDYALSCRRFLWRVGVV